MRFSKMLPAGLLLAACTTGPTGNTPPVLTKLDPVQIKVGERKQISVTAADEDGDAIRFYFELVLFPGEPKEATYRDAGSLPTGIDWLPGANIAVLQWGPSNNHVGRDHRLTVLADDGQGGRAEETTTVTIFPGEVGSGGVPGAPRFSLHPNLVLDLARSECVKARVRVEDPDSADVTVRLQDEPEGMKLKPTRPDGKEAELSWCPTRDQITERTVWSFWAVADDGDHEPVKQKMSVVIRPRGGGGQTEDCTGTPPEIHHEPLGEQQGTDDYEVEASISDAESTIDNAFVAYTWGDPEEHEEYVASALLDTGGGAFFGAISNVTKMEGADLGQPVRIYYYLCAVDDDDSGGDKCDQSHCDPPQSYHSFVAYPPGTEGGGGEVACPNDAREPNESPEASVSMPAASLPGLVLCPDDVDWWSYQAEAGDELTFRVFFRHKDGNLSLEVQDPGGGSTRSEDAADSDVREVRIAAAQAGRYSLGVSGADVDPAGATYELSVERRAGGGGEECPQDGGEPNNGTNSATKLQAGEHGPFGICGADDPDDYYAIDLTTGDTMTATVRFRHAEDGDLDLYLYAPGQLERPAAFSESYDDDESVTHTAAEDGTFHLRVAGFEGAVNTYRLELSIEEGGGAGGDECPEGDDGREPNDTQETASPLAGNIACARLTAADGESEMDWYRVGLGVFEGFTASFRFPHAAGDLDLELLAADGTTVVDRSMSGNDDEEIRFPGTPQGGSWYLRLKGFQGAANQYSVEYVTAPFGPGAGCMTDRLEPNNDQGGARFVVPGAGGLTELVGLSSCGDEDWYRVRVPEGKTLLGEIQFDASRGALDLQLQDENGAVAGNHDANAGNVLVDTNVAGTYFLRILGVEGASNLYELTVAVDE